MLLQNVLIDVFRCRHRNFSCRIHPNIKISEQECKIIFNEFNTNIVWLDILGVVEAVPDLSDALNKFENLQKLQLHNSRLKIVDRSKLTALKNLEILFLNNNEIAQLAADTFADFTNLKELGLDKNKLKEIDRDLFKDLGTLKILYFYGNQFEILPEDLFRNNQNLLHLQIQQNLLNELHPDLFQSLHNLEYLDVSGNRIEILPHGLFRNNENLQKILIHTNKIKTIESNFQHLSKLVELNLERNVCINEYCDVKTFCGTNSLTEMQTKIRQNC